jgi:hypothetical protein
MKNKSSLQVLKTTMLKQLKRRRIFENRKKDRTSAA